MYEYMRYVLLSTFVILCHKAMLNLYKQGFSVSEGNSPSPLHLMTNYFQHGPQSWIQHLWGLRSQQKQPQMSLNYQRGSITPNPQEECAFHMRSF